MVQFFENYKKNCDTWTADVAQSFQALLNVFLLGGEPWYSGYERRLVFQRS